MNVIKSLALISVIFFVSACAAPRYEGSPVTYLSNEIPTEVVVIKDDATKAGFLSTIEKWLTNNGYKYSVQPDKSNHDLEKLTIEYIGNWSWDINIYLSKAKIEAFHLGQRVGEVSYKAPNTLNTNKFGKGEGRIKYMLDVLFGKLTALEATQAIKS